jgi:hypothetical protein
VEWKSSTSILPNRGVDQAFGFFEVLCEMWKDSIFAAACAPAAAADWGWEIHMSLVKKIAVR